MRRWLSRALARRRPQPFAPYVKHKTIEGVAFDFWIGDEVGRKWYDTACTDPDWPEMRFTRDRLVAPGDVVLECGAHHGCTTVLLSNWVGAAGTVVAFDPRPENCCIIRRNVALNGLTNVVVEEKAVGAANGFVDVTGASNTVVTAPGAGRRVEMTRLDEYEHLGPTLLKLDVEGYESEVLKGARSVLARRPKFAIEVHTESLPQFETSVDELFQLLDVDRYALWILHEGDERPEPYDPRTPITTRVHLYGVPR